MKDLLVRMSAILFVFAVIVASVPVGNFLCKSSIVHGKSSSGIAYAASQAHSTAFPGALTAATSIAGLPHPPVIKGSNSVRFWAVLDKGTLWTTTVHQKAHDRFAANPGSIVWQISVPQSHAALDANTCGTNFFGIVLCK